MQELLSAFARLRRYCEREGFRGWDPYDGLNSRLFQALPLLKRSALCRLVVIQGFKRCPMNLRRLALVPKEYNAKGIGLCNLGRRIAGMYRDGRVDVYSKAGCGTAVIMEFGTLKEL